ncbi:MAG: acetate--CoA ligase family protein [Candidatus Aenigmarchaeota archaeon]|nr:acetate--CoA ligase family protein [Candidatus Aenigmarchaeota archaeon]
MRKLSPSESRRMMKKYGIPLVNEKTVKTKKAMNKLPKEMKYPVVLKIDSPDIIHKTEAKCVFTDIRNDKELASSSEKILKNAKKYNPKARITGFLVQEHFSGYETIVGGKIDEQFGPIVLFGAGGIFTELLGDTSIRICPFSRKDAEEMIDEIKFSRVLKGFRGEEPADRNKILDVIMSVERLMRKEKITELDINPLMVSGDGVRAVDVRIIKQG